MAEEQNIGEAAATEATDATDAYTQADATFGSGSARTKYSPRICMAQLKTFSRKSKTMP